MMVYGENNYGGPHAANVLPAHNGANVFVRKLSNRAGCIESDITPSGEPIATVMAPTGGGNHDISVIMDGVAPTVGTQDSAQQYDTYGGGQPQQFIGYTFPAPNKIGRVTFTEGKGFGNGGWFDSGPTVEVLVGGVWTAAEGLRSSPRYEASDHEAASSYETFVFTFDVSHSYSYSQSPLLLAACCLLLAACCLLLAACCLLLLLLLCICLQPGCDSRECGVGWGWVWWENLATCGGRRWKRQE
jgi:hypothetical protein